MKFNWTSPLRLGAALLRAVVHRILFGPLIATDEDIEARNDICLECSFYDATEGQCRACTCLVVIKVMLNSECCPVGKWKRIYGGIAKLWRLVFHRGPLTPGR